MNTITGKEQRYSAVEDAMEHFGLGNPREPQMGTPLGDAPAGTPAVVRAVHILAEVVRRTRKTIIVRPKNAASGKAWHETVEFMIEQVHTLHYKIDRALIKVPPAYVETFGLRACVLDAEAVENVGKLVEKYYKEL